MPLAGNMFRKAALEKLSSPERLDVMMRVTSPTGWLALSALGFIITALVVWSVVGQISTKVSGRGILMRGGTVYQVNSIGSGHVVSVDSEPGHLVEAGQVVARLDQPDLRLRIANKKEELASLSGQGAQQQSAQARIIARYQAQIAELRQKIARQQRLVDRGLLTGSQLMQTKQQLTSAQQAIASTRANLAGGGNRVANVRRQLRELESQLEARSEIRSPYTGRVLEIMTNPGDLIRQGAPILTLEDAEEAIKSVLFIPATEGKKIRPGMRADVAPSTVKPEEYGFIIGEVVSVSDYPLTPEGLVRVLRNRTLAQEFSDKTAPIEVVVSLTPDAETPSGFKWTSSKGPPTEVFSGTMCNGSVVVATKKPISYVIPVMKKAVGVS